MANTLVTAAQHLSQPCGPLPVKNCRVRHEGNENGKNAIFGGELAAGSLELILINVDFVGLERIFQNTILHCNFAVLIEDIRFAAAFESA